MNVFFFEVSLLLYFLGTALFLSQLAGRLEGVSQSAFVVAGIAFFFHTLALVSRMIEAGHIPLRTTHELLFFFLGAGPGVSGCRASLSYPHFGIVCFAVGVHLPDLRGGSSKRNRLLAPILSKCVDACHVVSTGHGSVRGRVCGGTDVPDSGTPAEIKAPQRPLPQAARPRFSRRAKRQSYLLGLSLIDARNHYRRTVRGIHPRVFLNWNAEQIGALGTWLFYLVVCWVG